MEQINSLKCEPTQSLMHLPLTNPFYFLDMIKGMIGSILSAKNFKIILNAKLAREMNWKSFMEFPLEVFGRRMKVFTL